MYSNTQIMAMKLQEISINREESLIAFITSHYGAVANSSANGLVGMEFTSRYRLQPRAAF